MKSRDCEFALAEVWEKGGEGGVAACKQSVIENIRRQRKADFKPFI